MLLNILLPTYQIQKHSEQKDRPDTFFSYISILLVILLVNMQSILSAQITQTERSGFTWISTENVTDTSFGAGYTMYSAAYPAFRNYPGPDDFQTGLSSSWLTTQRTGNEPKNFYTTIEGGLGWWYIF